MSRLVEYSKVTWQSAWRTHLMPECCNSVDITSRGCVWAAAPGKWSYARVAVTVSNYKAHLSLRGVATGVYIGIYTPKISPSKLLWGKNDVRTAIQQFYTPLPEQISLIPNSSHPVAVIAQQ